MTKKKERGRRRREFHFRATYFAIPLCEVGFTFLVCLWYSKALFRCQRRVFAAGEEVLKLAPSEDGERLHHHRHGRGRESIELLVGVEQQLQKIVTIDIYVRKWRIPFEDWRWILRVFIEELEHVFVGRPHVRHGDLLVFQSVPPRNKHQPGHDAEITCSDHKLRLSETKSD